MAGKIKEAFMGEKGLAGKVKALPMAKVFELKNVKSVSRSLRPTRCALRFVPAVSSYAWL